MVTLTHDGTKRYKERFDLVHRREAIRPNEIWQADHNRAGLSAGEAKHPPAPPEALADATVSLSPDTARTAAAAGSGVHPSTKARPS
jgi:hypothetical protein